MQSSYLKFLLFILYVLFPIKIHPGSPLTLTQEGVATSNVCRSISNLMATSPIVPFNHEVSSLENSTIGKVVLSKQRFFKYDKLSDTLIAFGSNGTNWYTIQSNVVSDSHHATFTLTFSSTKKDGVSSTTDTDLMELVFTRTSGTVTRIGILAFLNNIGWGSFVNTSISVSDNFTPISTTTKDLYTSSSAFIASATPLPKGWSVKLIKGQNPGNGASGISLLMPIYGLLSFPILSSTGGLLLSYTTTLADSSIFNAKSSEPTTALTFLHSATGYQVAFDFYAGKFLRSSSWWSQITKVLLPGAKFIQSKRAIISNPLPNAIDYARKLIANSDTAITATDKKTHVKSMCALLADRFHQLMEKPAITFLSGAGYTSGNIKAQLRPSNPQILVFGFTQQHSGWCHGAVTDGTTGTITLTARYADSITTTPRINPKMKNFQCTLSGPLSENTVYRFQSQNDDAIWLKIGSLGTFSPTDGHADATALASFIESALTSDSSYIPGLTLEELITLI